MVIESSVSAVLANDYEMYSSQSTTKCSHARRTSALMPNKPDWSTQSARLRWARETSGLGSARQVAADRGWPSATYISHENGSRLKKGLSEDDARRYARIFRVSLPWLLTGEGEPRRRNEEGEAMVMGRIGAGAIVSIDDAGGGWPIAGIPAEIAASCELYEVTGTSMLPLFRDGDVLAFEKRYVAPSRLLGSLALVLLPTGERLIKTIKWAPEGLYDLVSLNAEDIREAEIQAAGRLAWAKFA